MSEKKRASGGKIPSAKESPTTDDIRPRQAWDFNAVILEAVQANPDLWPDYCLRCGVEDDRPHDQHDAEFHSGKPLPPLLSLDDDDGCGGYLNDCATLRMCQCDRLGRE